MIILLVNMSEDVTNIISSQLEQCGHQVAIASNHQEAFQMLQKHKIQITISDCIASDLNDLKHFKIQCSTEIEHYVYLMALLDQSQNQDAITHSNADVDSFLYTSDDINTLREKIMSAQDVIARENKLAQDSQAQNEISVLFSHFESELTGSEIMFDELDEIVLSS